MFQSCSSKPIELGHHAFVFGGAYGNLAATKAILDQAKKLGFQKEQIIFTGDTVAYCGQPQETVDLIRENVTHIVQGNCEESLGEDADNCGCGFEEGSACNLLSVEWYNFCRSHLCSATKHWMKSLPKSLTFKIGTHTLECHHATPNAINEFVFPSDVENENFIATLDPSIDGYIVGHSGLPFIADINEKAWINSGAAGMPANDGTSRVWYATIESTSGLLSAETYAIEYDYQSVSNAMTRLGLQNGYKDCLSSGIWPSHDVLPEKETMQTGIALRPQRISIKKAKISEVA